MQPASEGSRADLVSDTHLTLQVEDELQDAAAVSTGVRASFLRRRRVAILSAAASLLVAVAVATVLVVFLQPRHTAPIAVPKTFAAQFTTVSKLDTSIAYDGKVFKNEDASGTWNWQVLVQSSVASSGASTKTVYTVINGAAYRQEVDVATGAVLDGRCMTADEIPPLQDLPTLFNNAAAMPNSEFDQEAVAECAGDDKQKVVLQWGPPTYRSQNAFVYCGVTDGSHRFISHQYVASVFNIDLAPPAEGLGLSNPVDVNGQALSCPVLVTPSMLTDLKSGVEARQLAAANAWYAAAAAYARRLDGPDPPSKTCVFVAGSGQTANAAPSTSLSSYWGPVHALVTAKCLKVRFIQRNMRDEPFTNVDYKTHFCAQVDANRDGDIDENVFIFSHGTGSLLVAAALESEMCSFSSDTNSKWYAAGSPMRGSPVATGGTNLCKFEQQALGTYMTRLGICRADMSARSNAMHSVATESLSDYREVFDDYVTGVMCGTEALGQNIAGKTNGVRSIGDYVSFSSEHDGFTTVSGCTPAETTLGTDYTKKYYKVAANVLDLTCRGGDAVLDLQGNRSPCSWYRERAS